MFQSAHQTQLQITVDQVAFNGVFSAATSNQVQLDVNSSMSQPFQQDARLDRHFALIYIDQEGNLCQQISPSIADSIETILSTDLISEFLKAVAESNQVCQSTQALGAGQLCLHSNVSQAVHSVKLAGAEQDMGLQHYSKAHVSSASSSAFARHVQANSKADLQRKEVPRNEDHKLCAQMTTISIHDKKFLRQYYEKVFQNLQQTNCRIIAKVYVKVVEPRKQAQYPYNGRKLVAGKIQQFSPEETKPPWWPTGVSHREPDHLLKTERITLLVHILCNLCDSHGITAERLKHAQESVKRQISPPERLQLLDELYRVRNQEEHLHTDNNASALVPISLANLPDSSKYCNIQYQISNQIFPVHQRQPYEPVTQNLVQCSRPEGEENSLNFRTVPHAFDPASFWQRDLMSTGLGSLWPSLSPGDLKRKRQSFERDALQAMSPAFPGHESSTIFAHQSLLQDTAEGSFFQEQVSCLAYYSWKKSFHDHS